MTNAASWPASARLSPGPAAVHRLGSAADCSHASSSHSPVNLVPSAKRHLPCPCRLPAFHSPNAATNALQATAADNQSSISVDITLELNDTLCLSFGLAAYLIRWLSCSGAHRRWNALLSRPQTVSLQVLHAPFRWSITRSMPALIARLQCISFMHACMLPLAKYTDIADSLIKSCRQCPTNCNHASVTLAVCHFR